MDGASAVPPVAGCSAGKAVAGGSAFRMGFGVDSPWVGYLLLGWCRMGGDGDMGRG